MKRSSHEVEAALDVADIARDLVTLWENQRIQGLPRSERNASIEHVRKRLTEAVRKWEDLRN